MKQVLNSGVFEPVGPYSPIIRAGDFVFISGQVAETAGGAGESKKDITEQTKEVMDNIKYLLTVNSLSMDDIVKCNIYLKQKKDFDAMNTVYMQYFKTYPARITLYVQDLYGDCEIEVDATAFSTNMDGSD